MPKISRLSHFYAQPSQDHLRVVLDVTIEAEGESVTVTKDITLSDPAVMAALDNLERAIMTATGAIRAERKPPANPGG
jgi:hypothetical protein